MLEPLLISHTYDLTPSYPDAFYIVARIVLVCFVIPFIVRSPKREFDGTA